MDLQLKNKVALVAASSKGIGYTCAEALLREGAKVTICARNKEVLEAAKADLVTINQNVLSVVADVSSYADIKNLVKKTNEHFGGLDILVTNAGGPKHGSFLELDDKEWKKTLELNLMSAVRLIRESLPYLKKSESGRIINISSIAAKQPMPEFVLSSSVRVGIHGLTSSLVVELGKYGITINNVMPGYTLTDRMKNIYSEKAAEAGKSLDEIISEISGNIPIKRIGKPEDVASLVTFLASKQAGYITGTSITIDGGVTKTVF